MMNGRTNNLIAVRQPALRRRRPTQAGMVLIVVLVAVAMLSLTGYTFTRLMFAERRAADTSVRAAQARALAESGLELAKQIASLDELSRDDLGGWFDNPSQFQGALVVDDEQAPLRGRVTLVAPLQEDGIAVGLRYGLENESAKLNLTFLGTLVSSGTTSGGTASGGTVAASGTSGGGSSGGNAAMAKDMLMRLPGMTDDIADSILDWLDDDVDTREYGAESQYYGGLSPPYACANKAPQTIEELLLVKGVTPALLFGADLNRNGLIDADESTDVAAEGVDNADGSMNCGWSAYLTLHSAEANTRSDGTPKIDLNQSDLQRLYDDLKDPLGDDYAKFIVAFRQATPPSGGPPGAPATYTTPVAPGQFDASKQAKNEFKTLLDVVGVQMRFQTGSAQQPGQQGSQQGAQGTSQQGPLWVNPFDTGSKNTYVPKLCDNCYASEAITSGGTTSGGSTNGESTSGGTTSGVSTTPGRININQAPRVVLQMLTAVTSTPPITDDIVDRIIGARLENPTLDEAAHKCPAWPYLEDLVNLEQMKALMKYVTAGGNVFRASAVGFFEGGGPTARLEAIFDATASPPTVLFWRDVSHLGRGYTLDVLNGTGK